MLFRQSIHTDFDMSGNSAMLPSLKHLDAFFQNCKIRLQIRLLFFLGGYLNSSMVYFN